MSSFPKMKPMRSELYRRLVAALPCIACGIWGRSNHAHANSGKGKGVKVDDRDGFPLCVDQPGKVGCHTLHDQRRMFPKHDDEFYRKVEKTWIQKTRRQIRAQARLDPSIMAVVMKTIGMENGDEPDR